MCRAHAAILFLPGHFQSRHALDVRLGLRCAQTACKQLCWHYLGPFYWFWRICVFGQFRAILWSHTNVPITCFWAAPLLPKFPKQPPKSCLGRSFCSAVAARLCFCPGRPCSACPFNVNGIVPQTGSSSTVTSSTTLDSRKGWHVWSWALTSLLRPHPPFPLTPTPSYRYHGPASQMPAYSSPSSGFSRISLCSVADVELIDLCDAQEIRERLEALGDADSIEVVPCSGTIEGGQDPPFRRRGRGIPRHKASPFTRRELGAHARPVGSNCFLVLCPAPCRQTKSGRPSSMHCPSWMASAAVQGRPQYLSLQLQMGHKATPLPLISAIPISEQLKVLPWSLIWGTLR